MEHITCVVERANAYDTKTGEYKSLTLLAN
jgi:hypothetical protein